MSFDELVVFGVKCVSVGGVLVWVVFGVFLCVVMEMRCDGIFIFI